ncbi:MAG: phosphate/phosphite/phosphonate ABC transporter substrate-binding protein [Leptolyngbyaceae cyanobacterium]
MFSKPIKCLLCFGILALAVSCSRGNRTADTDLETVASAAELTADQVLVIGDISSGPAEKIALYQPLADYLESRLTDVGIERATVKIAPDLDTMQTWLSNGEVDLYFDSPYPVMVMSTRTEAKPLLRRWKGGIAEYRSLIFTLNESDIQTTADLAGTQIALESDFSTSGYMLPLAYLQAAGLRLVEQSAALDRLQANEVGFVFSDDESNTVELVLSGAVDAGALDNGTFAALPEEVRSAMRIVLETDPVARHIVLVSAQTSAEQSNAIKDVLLSMDASSEGQATLESFENTAKFDEFPVEQSIDRLEELYNQTLE